MPRFFVLTKSSQHKAVAYAEVVSGRYNEEPIRCSACGRAVARLRWLPPFQVWLKNPRRIPDLIQCFGGPELLVSAALHEALKQARLKGIERAYPVEVARVGTRSRHQSAPSLFGIDLIHSYCRVNFDACDTTWSSPPESIYCKVCGPGGGGREGCFWSFQRLAFDIAGWDGEEIFMPINLAGTPILTEDAISKVDFAAFSGCRVVPAAHYSYAYHRVA